MEEGVLTSTQIFRQSAYQYKCTVYIMTITIFIEFVKIAITLFSSDGDSHFAHIIVSTLNAWFTLHLLL